MAEAAHRFASRDTKFDGELYCVLVSLSTSLATLTCQSSFCKDSENNLIQTGSLLLLKLTSIWERQNVNLDLLKRVAWPKRRGDIYSLGVHPQMEYTLSSFLNIIVWRRNFRGTTRVEEILCNHLSCFWRTNFAISLSRVPWISVTK